MVVEADESDGTFTRLPAVITVVTNIDPEHLDFYGSFDRVRDAFEQFVSNIPFYGFAAMCIDHPEVQAMIPRVLDRRIITYGFSPQADIRAVNLRTGPDGAAFDVAITDRAAGTHRTVEGVRLPMFGRHNVQNSLAALAVGHEMGMADDVLATALTGFGGVKRRFTKTGEVGGVTVIDDYGHHPVEIAAVLRAARDAVGEHKVIAVVQPHRFSRLANLFEDFCTCFNDADAVVVSDVYEAGEQPIEGGRPGPSGRRPEAPRPSAGGAAAGAGEPPSGRDRARDRPAGRLRGLPGRRFDHPLGERPSGGSWRRLPGGGDAREASR